MSFITEFLRFHIRSHMEDPEERQENWETYVRKLQVNSERKKEQWLQPTKPYGFWNSAAANSKYAENSEPAVKALYGRHTQAGK